MDNAALKKEFNKAAWEIYNEARVKLKYDSEVFYRMINDHGGLGAVKNLINAGKPSQGFLFFLEKGKLNLSAEALALSDPKWAPLFSEKELNRARDRLKRHGYKI